MLEKVDLLKYGADLMAISCIEGKGEVVKLLLDQGVSLVDTPLRLSDYDSYRQCPFTFMACMSGDVNTLKVLI